MSFTAFDLSKKEMDEKLQEMGQRDTRAQEDLFGWRENRVNEFTPVFGTTSTGWLNTISSSWPRR
jgi:hypothetical protein